MPVPYYFLCECRVGAPQRQCVIIMIGAGGDSRYTVPVRSFSVMKMNFIPEMVAIMIFYTCVLMNLLNYNYLNREFHEKC